MVLPDYKSKDERTFKKKSARNSQDKWRIGQRARFGPFTWENMCIFPPNTSYFEVEELYVSPEWRNKGIGTKLFHYVEQEVKKQNIEYILLSSATKDYQKVIHFYTQMGMDIWTMVFYKKI